jgi:hypothetical protein
MVSSEAIIVACTGNEAHYLSRCAHGAQDTFSPERLYERRPLCHQGLPAPLRFLLCRGHVPARAASNFCMISQVGMSGDLKLDGSGGGNITWTSYFGHRVYAEVVRLDRPGHPQLRAHNRATQNSLQKP